MQWLKGGSFIIFSFMEGLLLAVLENCDCRVEEYVRGLVMIYCFGIGIYCLNDSKNKWIVKLVTSA